MARVCESSSALSGQHSLCGASELSFPLAPDPGVVPAMLCGASLSASSRAPAPFLASRAGSPSMCPPTTPLSCARSPCWRAWRSKQTPSECKPNPNPNPKLGLRVPRGPCRPQRNWRAPSPSSPASPRPATPALLGATAVGHPAECSLCAVRCGVCFVVVRARSYKLLARAYPYMARRLLTDPAPELRESFEELVLKVTAPLGLLGL